MKAKSFGTTGYYETLLAKMEKLYRSGTKTRNKITKPGLQIIFFFQKDIFPTKTLSWSDQVCVRASPKEVRFTHSRSLFTLTVK